MDVAELGPVITAQVSATPRPAAVNAGAALPQQHSDRVTPVEEAEAASAAPGRRSGRLSLPSTAQLQGTLTKSTLRKAKRKAEAALDDTSAEPEAIPEPESIPTTLRFVSK